MRINLLYSDENVVRIRARSFSSVNGDGGLSAFKDVVGAAFVVFRPMPITDRNSDAS